MKINLVPKLLTLCSSAVLIVGIPTFASAKTVTQNRQQGVALTTNSNSSLITTTSGDSATSIPTAPVINQPGDITSNNVANYSISGTGTPGDLVKITLTDSQGTEAFGLATVNSNSEWSTTVDLQSQKLSSGEVNITATQSDMNGYDSPVSESLSVVNSYVAHLRAQPSIIIGGEVHTGVYVLNNRSAVNHLGHVATAIVTSNGEVNYCSFDTNSQQLVPINAIGFFDTLPTSYRYKDDFTFSSVTNFRKWLNTKSTGYSLSDIVFFKATSTEAQNALNLAKSKEVNPPRYYTTGSDCQTIMDNILGKAGFDVSYFSSPIPNHEVDSMEYLVEYDGGGIDQYDPQWESMEMWNPSNDTYHR